MITFTLLVMFSSFSSENFRSLVSYAVAYMPLLLNGLCIQAVTGSVFAYTTVLEFYNRYSFCKRLHVVYLVFLVILVNEVHTRLSKKLFFRNSRVSEKAGLIFLKAASAESIQTIYADKLKILSKYPKLLSSYFWVFSSFSFSCLLSVISIKVITKP